MEEWEEGAIKIISYFELLLNIQMKIWVGSWFIRLEFREDIGAGDRNFGVSLYRSVVFNLDALYNQFGNFQNISKPGPTPIYSHLMWEWGSGIPVLIWLVVRLNIF